jgi:hypothetical protein
VVAEEAREIDECLLGAGEAAAEAAAVAVVEEAAVAVVEEAAAVKEAAVEEAAVVAARARKPALSCRSTAISSPVFSPRRSRSRSTWARRLRCLLQAQVPGRR